MISWTLFLFLTIFLEVREICRLPHPGERCSTTFCLKVKSMSFQVILALRAVRPLLCQISGPQNMCVRTCRWFKPRHFLLTSFCMSCARPIHPTSFFYSESLRHSSFLPINLSSTLLKAWLHFLLMIYCHSDCCRRSNLCNTGWGMHMRQFPSDFCWFFSFNIQVYFPVHFMLIFQFFSLSGLLFSGCPFL